MLEVCKYIDPKETKFGMEFVSNWFWKSNFNNFSVIFDYKGTCLENLRLVIPSIDRVHIFLATIQDHLSYIIGMSIVERKFSAVDPMMCSMRSRDLDNRKSERKRNEKIVSKAASGVKLFKVIFFTFLHIVRFLMHFKCTLVPPWREVLSVRAFSYFHRHVHVEYSPSCKE